MKSGLVWILVGIGLNRLCAGYDKSLLAVSGFTMFFASLGSMLDSKESLFSGLVRYYGFPDLLADMEWILDGLGRGF
jgi:hypothetical protein